MVHNQTILNPYALLFVILMAVFLYRLPRQFAILPILVVALYLTMNLRIVITGFDFTMLRIMFVFGWIRILRRSETRLISLNSIDKILIVRVILFIATYTILWGTTGAFVNRLGKAFDIISMYFIPRILISDLNDIERLIKTLLIMSIPIAITMLIEQATGRNLFSVFNGVPAFSMIRNGQIRSQGAFAHPILAGNFGAVLVPLIVGLWWRHRIKKTLFIVGISAASIIVMTSASSGPFVACIAGVIGLYFWFLRQRMRVIFWGIIAGLTMLHIYMKAPVWALVMRLGTSGSSYHRFELIDQTIRHFNEWWLIGTRSTAHWGSLKTIGDVADFYCRIAVDSGLIGLVLFLTIISLCFKTVGRTVRQIENQPDLQKFIWAIGASLFAHTLAFIGISYVGSNLFILYMTFAILSTISMMDFRHGPFSDKKILT
jgi:hypothetical protein